jgi:hypothetical protein
MTMSLTANQLFKQYMSMDYEEREKFLATFKQLYDSSVLASKPMSIENRSRLKKMKEEND